MRFLRVSLRVLFGLVLLLMATAGALHIPQVQRWAVTQVVNGVSSSWGVEVGLERIRFPWWRLALRLEGLEVYDLAQPGSPPMVSLEAVDLQGWTFVSMHGSLGKLEVGPGEVRLTPLLAWWEGLPPTEAGPAVDWGLRWGEIGLSGLAWSIEEPDLRLQGELEVLRATDVVLSGADWALDVPELGLRWDAGGGAGTEIPAGKLGLEGTTLAGDSAGLTWDIGTAKALGATLSTQGRWDWELGPVAGGVRGTIPRWESEEQGPPVDGRAWLAAAGVPEDWMGFASDAWQAGWEWDVDWRREEAGWEAEVNRLVWGNRLRTVDTARVVLPHGPEAGPSSLPGRQLFSSLPTLDVDLAMRWAGCLDALGHLPPGKLPEGWEDAVAPLVAAGPDVLLHGEKNDRMARLEWRGSHVGSTSIRAQVAPGSQHWDAQLAVEGLRLEPWLEQEAPLPLDATVEARLTDFGPEGLPRACDWKLEASTEAQPWRDIGTWAAQGLWEARGGTGFSGRWEGDLTCQGGDWPMAQHFVWEPGDDGDWELALEGELSGLQPAGEGAPWKLVARNDFTLRRDSRGDYRFKAGLRNALLLDEGVPRMISRFDLMGAWDGSIAVARWESDLTQGNLRTSTDLVEWTNWLENERTRSEARVPVPVFETSFQLRRFEPVAALLRLPLQLADGTQVVARLGEKGVSASFRSGHARWETFEVEDLFIEVDGTASELYGTILASEVGDGGETLLTDLAIDIRADSTWKIDIAWVGWDNESLQVRSEVQEADGDWWVDLYEASLPLGGERLVLSDVPACMVWTSTAAGWRGSLENFRWEGAGLALELEGRLGPESYDALQIRLESDRMPDLSRWGIPTQKYQGLVCEAECCAPLGNWSLRADAEVRGWTVEGRTLERVEAGWEGNLGGGSVWISATEGGKQRLSLAGQTPFSTSSPIRLRALLHELPLAWAGLVIDPAELALTGGLSGRVDITGTYLAPVLRGRLAASDATARIGYLGTTFGLQGALLLDPDYIGLDNWVFTDDQGHRAVMTGTLLHEQFAKWSYDVSLDLGQEPLHIMELTRKDNDYFFGTAYATGDVNVFGYGDRINIDARLRTEKGTTFALPLDGASDATYADFISFRLPDAAPAAAPETNPTRVRLNLALDITENAQARIIFDEAVGDEIVGQVRGALNLNIDDFERFAMTGGLEVVQGSYLFTLQNIINKKFVVDPGGTITWFGDPYAAEIDLDTRYRVRTRLQELLPNEASLPGRSDVDLVLGLQGNLLRPDIGFQIEVPGADTRLQALVESALINEEELNRQAISLLVLQQFLSPDPTAAAIGTTGLQERSTEFLAAQVGNWLSQATNDVDVGLDYGANAVSGEQALAVALSTRLLDDRLHLEGAVGTQRLTGGNGQDFQVQDVRVSYDLKPGGAFQVTGYTQMNPVIPGQEGTSTQGVGIRFRKEFAYLREIFRQRKPAPTGEEDLLPTP